MLTEEILVVIKGKQAKGTCAKHDEPPLVEETYNLKLLNS